MFHVPVCHKTTYSRVTRGREASIATLTSMEQPSERKPPLRQTPHVMWTKSSPPPGSASGNTAPTYPLQTIAATAGVGPATLFRNFSDKEQLVLAALSRQLRLHVDPVAAAAADGMDAAEGLINVIDA